VAQRCLYGVDKNPMAVDLAKLSLWLATLAKDHAFTFLDHALRCGDSWWGSARRTSAAFTEAGRQADAHRAGQGGGPSPGDLRFRQEILEAATS